MPNISLGLNIFASQLFSDAYGIDGFNPAVVYDYTSTSGVYGTGYFRKAGGEVAHDDLLTHTTSTNGTVTDSDGLLKWRAHNIVLHSGDATSDTLGRLSATANQITAPDGTTSGDLMTQTTSTTAGYIGIPNSGSLAGGGQTYTAIVKNGTCDWVRIQMANDPSAGTAWFNLSSGTVGTVRTGVTASIAALGDGWYKITAEVSAPASFCILYIGDGDGTATAVIGETYYIWRRWSYRSDLGGMQSNPDNVDSGYDSYVPTTSAAVYKRRNNYNYSGSEWIGPYGLIESDAATNICTSSNVFTTGNWIILNGELIPTKGTSVGPDGNSSMSTLAIKDTTTVIHRAVVPHVMTVDTNYTISMVVEDIDQRFVALWHYGNTNHWALTVFDLTLGTITSEQTGSTSGTIVQNSIDDIGGGMYYISMTAQVSDVALTESTGISFVSEAVPTLSSSGSESYSGVAGVGVYAGFVNVVEGSIPSSYIPTAGTTVTRAAETSPIPAANMPAITTEISGATDRLITYADTGTTTEQTLFDWRVDANNRITVTLDTAGALTGKATLTCVKAGVSTVVSSTNQITAGINVAAKVAWRVTTTEINIALNGTAATAITNAAGMPALGAVNVTSYGMADIDNGLVFAADIGDAGIIEAST